jgi:hypothetical protein
VSLAATGLVPLISEVALAVKQIEQIATINAADSNDFFTLVFMCEFLVFVFTHLVGGENQTLQIFFKLLPANHPAPGN